MSQPSVDPQKVIDRLGKTVAEQAILIAKLQAYIEQSEQEKTA